MKKLGYGKDYAYDPGFQHPVYNVSSIAAWTLMWSTDRAAGILQEFMPMELLDQSTYGPESLLKAEPMYEMKTDKQWDESKLEDWEFKRNGSRDWEGRVARS